MAAIIVPLVVLAFCVGYIVCFIENLYEQYKYHKSEKNKRHELIEAYKKRMRIKVNLN